MAFNLVILFLEAHNVRELKNGQKAINGDTKMVKYKTEIMAPDGVLLGVMVDGVKYEYGDDNRSRTLLDSPHHPVNNIILEAIGNFLKVHFNGPHHPVKDSPHSAALAYNRANKDTPISPLILSGLAGDVDWFYVGMCCKAHTPLLANVLNLVMCCLRFNGNPAIK
jgi:hypothetical protein